MTEKQANYILAYRYDEWEDAEWEADEYTTHHRTDHAFKLYRAYGYPYTFKYDPEYPEVEYCKCENPEYEGPWTVVYTLYEDGSTFGTTTGYVEFWGVFPANDQDAINACIEKTKDAHDGYFSKHEGTYTETFEKAPWIGGGI